MARHATLDTHRRSGGDADLWDRAFLDDLDVGSDGPDAHPQEEPVRRSLTIGRADDPAEREADRMADAALRSLGRYDEPAHPVRRSDDPLGGSDLDQPLQRSIEQARAGGRPLGDREREMFSSSYGVDLAPVRVHTGPDADRLSRSLHAEAFTVESDVFFRDGAYAPGTASGDHLIGHELAHVAAAPSEPAVRRFMSADDFMAMTYQSRFTRRSRAQELIRKMLLEYSTKVAPGGVVADDRIPEAVTRLRDMVKISQAWISDHSDERGDADQNRARRYDGFLAFIGRAEDRIDELSERAGGEVDTSEIAPDVRLDAMLEHYLGAPTPMFMKVGAALDKGLTAAGQSTAFSTEVKIPIPPGFVGGTFEVEASRTGDGENEANDRIEAKVQVKITGGFNVGWSEISAGLGGYVAAKGVGAQQTARLLEYGLYRRVVESNVIPWEVGAYFFGGSANVRGRRRAERKAGTIEKDAFGDSGDADADENNDSYAETGGVVSGDASASIGLAGVAGGTSATSGKRTDRTSLAMAGIEPGSKKGKAASLVSAMTGGQRGKQESTGRAVRSFSAHLSAELAVPLVGSTSVGFGYDARWGAQPGPSGNRVMAIEESAMSLSAEVPAASLDVGLPELVTAVGDRVTRMVEAAGDETADEFERSALAAEIGARIDDAKAKAADAARQLLGAVSSETIGITATYDFMTKEFEIAVTSTTTESVDIGVASMEYSKTETLASVTVGGSKADGDDE